MDWFTLVQRAVTALERIADALEAATEQTEHEEKRNAA